MKKRENEVTDLLYEVIRNIEFFSQDNLLKFENSKKHNCFLLRGLIDTVLEENPQVEYIDYEISYNYITDYNSGDRLEDNENTKYFEIIFKDSHPAGFRVYKLLVRLDKEKENE